MNMSKVSQGTLISLFLFFVEIGMVFAQPIQDKTPEEWITVTEQAAGISQKSKDEAIAKALRRAVEQACGVFLTSESKMKNYQGVYDQVFADAAGYVKEFDVVKTWIQDGSFYAKVNALVSTQQFEKDWAVIAHTLRSGSVPARDRRHWRDDV
jgi:hypothetical protein